ncbi:hypothetical protein F4678DRAFT_464164 [Xylaria arbuscula]|nr:hypothetical protein F4678DRAFT_464164 [Xylaria arbuscula]
MRFLGAFSLLSLAATFLNPVYGHPTTALDTGNELVTKAQELSTTAARVAAPNERKDVENLILGKRDIKMRLWYSSGGQMLFLLGRTLSTNPLPQELIDLIVGRSQGVPGQLLLRNFYNYIETRNDDLFEWLNHSIQGYAQIGGIYGERLRYGDYGFAFNIPTHLISAGTAGEAFFQMLITEVQNWASQNSAAGDVAVQLRSNGFFDPAIIGGGPSPATKRSRTDQCPNTNYNVLSIANDNVPNDVDINTYYRWVNRCPN